MRSNDDSSGECPLLYTTFVFFLWLYYLVILAASTFFPILFFYRGSSRLVQTRNLLIETHARYSRAMPVSAQQKYSNFAGITFEVCLYGAALLQRSDVNSSVEWGRLNFCLPVCLSS